MSEEKTMENNKKFYEELQLDITYFLVQCDEYDPSETSPDDPYIGEEW